MELIKEEEGQKKIWDPNFDTGKLIRKIQIDDETENNRQRLKRSNAMLLKSQDRDIFEIFGVDNEETLEDSTEKLEMGIGKRFISSNIHKKLLK